MTSRGRKHLGTRYRDDTETRQPILHRRLHRRVAAPRGRPDARTTRRGDGSAVTTGEEMFATTCVVPLSISTH